VKVHDLVHTLCDKHGFHFLPDFRGMFHVKYMHKNLLGEGFDKIAEQLLILGYPGHVLSVDNI
jgi:hypothetical protein